MPLQDYQEMPVPLSRRQMREDAAREEYLLNEQAAIAQEQQRRKKLSDLQADPNVQAFMAREAENRQLAQAMQKNPKLQEQYLLKLAETRLPQKPAGPPANYRFAADGKTLEFIPGGPADPKQAQALHPKTPKPITEFEGKNALYGSRAQMADRVLNNLEDKINQEGLAVKQSVQGAPVIGGLLGAAGNVMLSANQQSVEQAQRNFVNAVLRQESGAVISEAEFENAKKQYFRQPGDSAQVVKQKRANRQAAIQGFKKIAGPAWSEVEEADQSVPSEPAAPSAAWTPEKENRYQELLRKRGGS